MTEHYKDLGHLSNRISEALKTFDEVIVSTLSGKQYRCTLGKNGWIRSEEI